MKLRVVLLTIALLGIASTSYCQPDTTWQQWNWLIGEWVGQGSGKPGEGGGEFSFQTGLDGRILVRKSHSEYPATAEHRKIVHDDLMIVYLDNSGKPGRAIYFDNEGHTIEYAVEYQNRSIILTSNSVKGSPMFRLTYISLDKESISVKFEMSRDGKIFQTYIEGTSRRKK